MNRIEQSPFPLSDHYQQLFRNFCPSAHIEIISYSNLPDCAIDLFEGYNRRFIIPIEYFPGNFHYIFHIAHTDSTHTWAAWQTKPIHPFGAETLLYLCDSHLDREKTGYGEIEYNLTSDNPFFVKKPFVGYTNTEPKYVKHGLGTRRLFIMNALSLALWNLPLHSGTIIADKRSEQESSETDLWNSLVMKGFARVYQEINNKTRYTFIPDKKLYQSIVSSVG
jgi:hypothetical protein